jgi:hypothetical protein
MTYALGFRVKSGHAVAVALTGSPAAPAPLLQAVVALSDPKIEGTRQPYHAGFGTSQEDPAVVARLARIVQGCARRSVDELLKDPRVAGGSCRGAALVVGSVIDPQTVGNLHIRAHAHEGKLFRRVLAEALQANDVRCTIVVEKTLADHAAAKLQRSSADIKRVVGGIGRALGGPWRSDEKAAAAAAWVALL